MKEPGKQWTPNHFVLEIHKETQGQTCKTRQDECHWQPEHGRRSQKRRLDLWHRQYRQEMKTVAHRAREEGQTTIISISGNQCGKRTQRRQGDHQWQPAWDRRSQRRTQEDPSTCSNDSGNWHAQGCYSSRSGWWQKITPTWEVSGTGRQCHHFQKPMTRFPWPQTYKVKCPSQRPHGCTPNDLESWGPPVDESKAAKGIAKWNEAQKQKTAKVYNPYESTDGLRNVSQDSNGNAKTRSQKEQK